MEEKARYLYLAFSLYLKSKLDVMNPYNWINNFRCELAGETVNQTIFSLMLANKFKGDVYVNTDEYEILDMVVLIDGVYYDIEGIVESGDIPIDEYVKYDKLSLISHTETYNQVKWWFLNETKDEHYQHN
jgi:hypothetical protein